MCCTLAGYFPGGIDAARLFLPPERTVVSVVDRNGIGDTYSTLENAQPITALPVALVVDAKTASASEVFSAALSENGRATLVGHKTFGKAKVQTLNQLFDGSGVAVTINLYTTPQG
jgi:carboxyl-terminal processing protease